MIARLLARVGLVTPEQRAWAWYDWANSVYFTTVITAVFPSFYATYAAKGLEPAKPLGRAAWIRRVTLDLTGLPPTPEEVDQFLADRAGDAYERVADRLLASPRYGERWASKWLDVVRYADTNGFELDLERPHAWRYRDYVVASFNADKPYDRFVKEQIAGDELYPDSREALIATGYLRAGSEHLVAGNVDPDRHKN